MWTWNETSGNFNNGKAVLECNSTYGYPIPHLQNSILHLVWTGNGSATRASVWYMYSDDAGVTWKNVSGTTMSLPLFFNNMSCFVTENDNTWQQIWYGAIQDANQRIRILYMKQPRWTNYTFPISWEMAYYSASLGSAGLWQNATLADVNGNTFENHTLCGLIFDENYQSSSFWSYNQNGTIRKYVESPLAWYKYECVYNETEANARMTHFQLFATSPSVYEITVTERKEVIGYRECFPDCSDKMLLSHNDILACKFTANQSGYVTAVQFKGRNNGGAPASAYFRTAIYNSSLCYLGSDESNTGTQLMSISSIGNVTTWSLLNFHTTPTYVIAGQEYYLAIKPVDLSGINESFCVYCKAGTLGQTILHMQDLTPWPANQSFPDNLCVNASYSYELCAVGIQIATKLLSSAGRSQLLQTETFSAQVKTRESGQTSAMSPQTECSSKRDIAFGSTRQRVSLDFSVLTRRKRFQRWTHERLRLISIISGLQRNALGTTRSGPFHT
jgi:hypothetical protein